MQYTRHQSKLPKRYPSKDIIFAPLIQYPKLANHFPSLVTLKRHTTQPNKPHTIKATQSRGRNSKIMASTACFLHHHAPSTASRTTPSQRHASNIKPSQLICRAQKQTGQDEESNAAAAGVSRRLALTVLIGAAAIGTKVSPADAAYGEAGNDLSLSIQ